MLSVFIVILRYESPLICGQYGNANKKGGY